jgi:Domain of unknown function (DUF4352)
MRKSITIALAVLLLIVVIVGFMFWQEIHNQPGNNPTNIPTSTPIESTPIPTAVPAINVFYHTTVINEINNETPRNGYQFILVDLTITNNGYPSCQATIFNFQLTGSNNISYGAFWSNYNRQHSFSVNIANGESFNGSLLTSLPSGVSVTSFGGLVEISGKDLAVYGIRY